MLTDKKRVIVSPVRKGQTITGLLAVVALLNGEEAAGRNVWMEQVPLVRRVVQFVEWPGGAVRRGRVTVGLVGFGGRIAVVRPMEERGLDVRTVTSVERMKECDVLLFAPQAGPRTGGLLRLLEGEPVLTMGAIPGFARMGGMVELPDPGAGRRLTVNLGAARRSGLRVHPGLMGAADFLRRE